LRARHATFVTLHERSGKLRGCAGTIAPCYPNLVTETWHSARLTAFRDTRFEPVEAREMANLYINVSVLHSMEEIASASELDPGIYGVIVSTEDGRRGLLLPALPEITTVEEQLHYARRKALIAPEEPVHLQRFKVDYFEEKTE
jgi:AmmeMemoRadiSam system protein A